MTARRVGPTGATTEPPSQRTGSLVWLALIVALLGLLGPGTPLPVAVLSLIAVAVTLVVSLRWQVGGAAVIVLLTVGIALRLVPPGGYSDVLAVTEAAIREMLNGGNPYGHGYAESFPAGAPFAYGPVALLWYLPSLEDPPVMESLASMVVLGLLAFRGRLLGLAIYAVTPALVVSATDGSNDTTAGLLILISLLVAVRKPVAGAVLLAIATAFKPYALAWLPGLLGYAGAIGPLLAFVAASALLWLPALLAWGPDSLWWSFRRADEVHAQPYYSLAYALGSPEAIPKPAWGALRVAIGGLLAVGSLRGSARRHRWSSPARWSSAPRSSWAGGAPSPTWLRSRRSYAGISMTGSAWAATTSAGRATRCVPSPPGSMTVGP